MKKHYWFDRDGNIKEREKDIKICEKYLKVLPRLELGSPDSESGVLTITP